MALPRALDGFRRNPPASEAAVAELQKKIGRKLPADYRELLLAANGATGSCAAGPMEFFAAEEVIPETTRAEVPENSPGLFLIGRFAEGDFMAIDCRARKTCYATFELISDATSYRGTTLEQMLASINAGEPVPEPRKPSAKLRQDKTNPLELAREFGVSKDGRVTALAVHGDTVLAGSMWKPAVRLWNWRTGKQIRELKTDRPWAWGASISKDGRLGLVWFHNDPNGKTAPGYQVWNLDTGTSLSTFDSPSDIAGAVITSDEEFVCVNADGGMSVFDATTGDLKRQGQGPTAARSIDVWGEILGIGSEGLISLYDVRTLKPLCKATVSDVGSNVEVVRFSADGKLVLTITWNESTVFAAADCRMISRLPLRDVGFSGAFVADGRCYVRQAMSFLLTVDSASAEVKSKTRGKQESFWRLAASDDGRSVMSCGDSSGLIRVWTLP